MGFLALPPDLLGLVLPLLPLLPLLLLLLLLHFLLPDLVYFM
jgi:hypothetical protein